MVDSLTHYAVRTARTGVVREASRYLLRVPKAVMVMHVATEKHNHFVWAYWSGTIISGSPGILVVELATLFFNQLNYKPSFPNTKKM